MFQHYINGALVDGEGELLKVMNPANDEVVGTLKMASAEQAQEALLAAKSAQKQWAKTPLEERIAWLDKFYDAIWEEGETIVDLLSAESGKPYLLAKRDLTTGTKRFKFFAEEGRRVFGETIPDYDAPRGKTYHIVERRPIGVVVGHLAWNYPMGNAGLKIAPSLVSGCACVLKPSSQTPLSTLYLAKIAHKIGLPKGVLNVIAGSSRQLGPVLNGSDIPRMLTLIGGTDTGRQVQQQGSVSIKTYSLELGGNGPVIIMPDANIELAAKATVEMKTSNAGQICDTYNRIYVHKDVHADYIGKVLQYIQGVKIGSMRDEGAPMGPMISKTARDRMLDLVKDAMQKGASLLYGGSIPEGFADKGNFIMPTLLDGVTDDMLVFREEIFGPIIAVQQFEDLDTVLAKANDTSLGLTSFLYSENARVIAHCFEEIESGELIVNDASGGLQLPHVGIKQSGVGCDNSKYSLLAYFDLKRLDINLP